MATTNNSSQPQQSQWLLRRRERLRLSRYEMIRQRILLFHRHKCFAILIVLVIVIVYRVNQGLSPSSTVSVFPWSRNTLPFNLRHLPTITSLPPSTEVIQKLNKKLRDPDQILQWLMNQPFLKNGSSRQGMVDRKSAKNKSSREQKKKLVQLTSFGPSGLVIMDKLHRMGELDHVPILTIDTLHLFPETYQLWKACQAKYGKAFHLHVYTPEAIADRKAFDDKYGNDLWHRDPDRYGYLTKYEPTHRALDQLHVGAWMTGRRQSQGGERENLAVLELEEDTGRLKINPLAYWTYDDVWNYIRKYNVPYNELHDQGYKSIGDVMTTRAVGSNDPERSGRFVGLNRTECGMHSHLEKLQELKEEAAANNVAFVKPTLLCEYCTDVDLTSFQSDVVQANVDILLEFYSPLCGACQEFSPSLQRIAKQLANTDIGVYRFDITSSDLSDEMRAQGFQVEVTPTLYFVRHNPLRLSLYEGMHEELAVIDWLEQVSGRSVSNH